MSDVSILVLGGSGSGKTCFMLAMYDDMRLGYGGFTFSARDVDDDHKLVDRFARIVQGRDEQRWPSPTDKLEAYEFSLNYALRRFMRFTWHDYRGAMIRESGEPNTTVRELTREATVVMVCTPGSLLFRASVRNDRRAVSEMLIAEVQQVMEADSDVRPSVVILVTKFDEFVGLCQKQYGELDDAAIEAHLLAAVRRQYHTFFAAGGHWRVLVCPVSLGPELFGREDDAPIEPQNMHIPVMYAYHEHARNLAQAWAQRVEEKAAEVAQLRGGAFDGLFTRNRTLAALGDLDTLQEHHQTVQSRISIVLSNLSAPLFFEDGQPANLVQGDQ